MEQLNLVVTNNIFAIAVVLGVLLLIALVLIAKLSSQLKQLQSKYDYFTKGEEANIDTVLLKTLQEQDALNLKLQDANKAMAALRAEHEERFGKDEAKHEELREHVSHCLQNVKMKRYDAFDAMGGELSYSIYISDEHNDGIIMSSIYDRQESRCYAKEVKGGKPSHLLSDEEKELLK